MPKPPLDKNNILDAADDEPGPLEAKILKQIEEEEQLRESERPARMRMLAGKNKLGLPEWIEITGFGPGSEMHYEITLQGVRFVGWGEDKFSRHSTKDQVLLAQQNEAPGLTFPCTPQDLQDFVDSGICNIRGSFFVPDEFRLTVIAEAEESSPGEEEVKTHYDLDGSPTLRKGKNSRNRVEVWVKWQAPKLVKSSDNGTDLVDRIWLLANKCGYQSDRTKEGGTITKPTITKMLPPEITGGRAKSRSNKKK